MVDPLLVVHELVEIDEILKMGLTISKDSLIKNPEKVDDAHLKAARVELLLARSIGAEEHLRSRLESMERWCIDETLSISRRAEYRQLVNEAKACIEHLRGRVP